MSVRKVTVSQETLNEDVESIRIETEYGVVYVTVDGGGVKFFSEATPTFIEE